MAEEGKSWCNFAWSPHRPCVLSDRRPLITFKFFSAHEKTREKKTEREKKLQPKMGWNETLILWKSHYNNLFKDHQMHKGLQRKV